MWWWHQCCRWLQHGDGGADVDCGSGGVNIDDNCGFGEDGSRCIGCDRGSSVSAYGYGGGGSGADDNVGGGWGAGGGADCKKNEKCQM